MAAKSLLAKVLAGIIAAAGNENAAQRAPLLPPPAWIANHTYASGEVCTNAGAGAGNLYIATTYGASAASGGPTGQGPALLVDNAQTWQYFGPVLTTVASITAPAVSAAALSTAPAGSWYYANALDTANAAAPAGHGYFTFDGGYWQDQTAAFNGLNGITCYGNLGGGSVTATVGGIASAFWTTPGGSVTFRIDAPKMLISASANGGNGCYVEVDDAPLSDTYYYTTAANGIVLDFTAAGGIKPRKIRVYCSSFHGVSTMDAVSQVWAYVTPNPYQLAVVGDSTTQGSGAGPFGAGNWNVSYRIARLMGCENVVQSACGAMGFYTTANGYNFTTSTIALTLTPPDLILVNGNFDDKLVASATRQAAILNFLVVTRARFPLAYIVFFGPWGANYNGNATITGCEADIAAAVMTFADPWVYFIPLIARPTGKPWVDGVGNTQNLSGTGNADRYVAGDGTHPIALAIKDYMAWIYVESLKSVLSPLGTVDRNGFLVYV